MAIITFKDADGVEQTLDTGQKFNVAYHADCLEVLRAMPDQCIDLIVADPPYGDGNPDNDTEHRNQRGRFDKYNDGSQTVNVEREREREREREAPRHTTGSGIREADSSDTSRTPAPIPRRREKRPLEKIPPRR